MSRYRVWARAVVEEYTDVDAESEDEALAIARKTVDTVEWTNPDPYGCIEWAIVSAEELEEEEDSE
jgi:hypothetical protein